MPAVGLARRLVAEAIGTAGLLVAVVGSGTMATNLTRDVALALMANSIATGATLVVLVTILGPLSGAHLNPIVSLVAAIRRTLPAREAAAYCAAQTAGALVGVTIAHGMFSQPVLSFSQTVRTGGGQWLAEAVAAFGLVATVLLASRYAERRLPTLVGLYIVGAYWFTASTSFANPAAALARSLAGSFAGIRPADVPAFIVSETLGALLAVVVVGWLVRDESRFQQG